MNVPDQGWNQEGEGKILERLKRAYEEQGYSFIIQPTPDILPAFLGSYKPDAIASRLGENIIIEIRSRNNKASENKLSEIHHKIAPEKTWKLNVVYSSESQENSLAMPVPQLDLLHRQIAEIRDLTVSGHVPAAFILSWSLLEAALNRVNGDALNHVRRPGQVVQALAMKGYLGRDAERRLARLSELRNRIVHGDLAAPVSGEDVDQVLEAVNETLLVEHQ